MPAAAQTPASSRAFDGTWFVTLTCTGAFDGALGYTYHFPVQVTNGMLHGENGVRNMAGWLTLDGLIERDGTATLSAAGLTNVPDFTVGRVRNLTPYRYHVAAHFDATRGSGTRIELRPCALQFVKS